MAPTVVIAIVVTVVKVAILIDMDNGSYKVRKIELSEQFDTSQSLLTWIMAPTVYIPLDDMEWKGRNPY